MLGKGQLGKLQLGVTSEEGAGGSFAQAQAIILQTYRGFAQAQTKISTTRVFAQSLALIINPNEIAFDTYSTGAGVGTVSWTHTPINNPSGIILLNAGPNGSTSITSASYGGVALTKVNEALAAFGAQSHAAIWYLGNSIPTGPQTVIVNANQNDNFIVISVTASDYNIKLVDQNTGVGGAASNVTLPLSYSNQPSMAFIAAGRGGGSPSAGETLVYDAGHFNGHSWFFRQLFPSTADFNAGWSGSEGNAYSLAVAAFTKLPQRLAQATALIDSPIKVQFAQAQAHIIVRNLRGVAQAQARILATYNAFAQAQATVDQYYRSGNAQARVSGISLVQSTVTTSATVTLSNLPQPGNLLVAFYSSRGSNSGTVYTLDNGTWTLVARAHAATNGNHVGELSYQIVPPGGLSASTTISGGSSNLLYGILEFSGINISDPLDVFSTVDANFGATTTTLTPERAETLLVSFVSNYRDAGNDFTPVAGMTELYDVDSNGFNPQVEVNYQIVPMATGSSYTVGYTNFTNDGSLLIGAAFTGRAHIGVAQALAFINILGHGRGQAQARILQTYNGFGQAQALIDDRFALAQAQARIAHIQFIQAASGTTSATLSTGATAGNLLFAYWFREAGTVSPPSGWTNIETNNYFDTRSAGIAYKYATGGETTFAPTGGSGGGGTYISEWNGVSGPPVASAQNATVSTYHPLSQITPPSNRELIIFGTATLFGYSGNTLTPDSGYTELYQAAGSGNSGGGEAYYQFITSSSGTYTVGATYGGTNRFELGLSAAFQVYPYVSGQAQAKLNSFDYPQFGQAQAQIGMRFSVCAQAQANIKIISNAFGQALAFVGHFQSAQAQASIKATSNAYGQAKAFIGHFQVGQAQAKINAFDVNRFGQAQALIYHPIGLGQAQARILQTYNAFANAQGFILPTTGKGQSATWVKQTYPLMSLDTNYALPSMGATATDSIGQTIEPSYTIDGNDYGFRWTIVGIAQDQYLLIDLGQYRTINYYRVLPTNYDATVKLQYNADTFFTHYDWRDAATLPQFNVGIFDDVDTSKVVTGEINSISAREWRILVIDDGSNNGIALATVELGFATVKSPTFAQAQAFLGHFGIAQAQVYISPGFGIAHGQAKADISETFRRSGQANAWVIKPQVYGQALGDILQIYSAFAQVPCWIIPPTVIANAQATIKAYDVEGFAQATADIKAVISSVANAKAMIHKQGGFGQAIAQIKQGRRWGFGQARARIGNLQLANAQAYIIKAQGYGQARASIKQKFLKAAQAQALIIRHEGYGQARAGIRQVYAYHGFAVAIMNQTFGIAQANSEIKQTYNLFAQANARLKNIATNYSNPYGQAQSVVHIRYYIHGQAQAYTSVRHRPVGQAMAFINSFKIGQAQARIFAFDYPRNGQAQAYIKVNLAIQPQGPTSEAHSYLVRYNNYDLPGYAQEESYDSVVKIGQGEAYKIDGSLSQYLGLRNKEIFLRMRAWESTYAAVKEKVQKAASMLHSQKKGFAKLYVQQPDAHFLAMVNKIEVQKNVKESGQILDYRVTFEAMPWLISNDTYEISGTGLIDTGSRTIYDGGWTPTKILVSGTDVEITAYTETGDTAGSITIAGTCSNLVVDSENFIATENGENRNDIISPKNYGIYVGPGKTFFQINNATSCVIQYQNRWYLASTRRRSTQTVASTVLPTIVIQRGFGQAGVQISSGTLQKFGQARVVIEDPIKRAYGQVAAQINSPITRAFAQTRAFLRNGRTSVIAQAQARIRVIGSGSSAQARAFIEGATKYKFAQARAQIRQHRQIGLGQARAKILTLPPAPSSFVATPGDTQVTLTWV